MRGQALQPQNLVPGIIVVKTTAVKADIEIALKQVAQITTRCRQNNIEVIDIITTFGSSKDISKRVKTLLEHKEVKILFLYTAKQVAKTEEEFLQFATDMKDFYGLQIVCYR